METLEEEEKPVKGAHESRERPPNGRQPGGKGGLKRGGHQQFPALESGQES